MTQNKMCKTTRPKWSMKSLEEKPIDGLILELVMD